MIKSPLVCQDCRREFPRGARGRPPKRCPACRELADQATKPILLPDAPPVSGEETAGRPQGRNERAVRAALEAANRLESIPGAAALDAAVALDTMALTGAARAALLKEMRTAAAEALKGVVKSGSKVDEIRAAREARRASAG